MRKKKEEPNSSKHVRKSVKFAFGHLSQHGDGKRIQQKSVSSIKSVARPLFDPLAGP